MIDKYFNPNNENLMTANGANILFRISDSTAMRWKKLNKLKSFKINNRVRAFD